MQTTNSSFLVEESLHNLLFHQDPDTRVSAALRLEGNTSRIGDQRLALEALTVALRDPCSTVQEAVLQSLMRMSVTYGSRGPA